MRNFLRPFSFPGGLSRKDLVRVALPVVALALIASVVTGREKPSAAAIEPAARIDARLQASDQDLDLSKLARESGPGPEAAADPFARRNFAAPQGAAQGEAAAAPAAAPPLPFTYLGKAIEDGRLEVFLGRGAKSYSVRAGQKIDGDYRVDKLTQDSVTFVYLPLRKKQILDIPAVN